MHSKDLIGLRILVVDDEADARDLLACLLESAGATVYLADAAATALAILASHTTDVMVSDIGMPDEDGYSLMRNVRSLPHEDKRTIPAIALTAFTRDVDRQCALTAGFDVHLGKPLQPPILVRALRELMHARAAAAQSQPRTSSRDSS